MFSPCAKVVVIHLPLSIIVTFWSYEPDVGEYIGKGKGSDDVYGAMTQWWIAADIAKVLNEARGIRSTAGSQEAADLKVK